MSIKVYRCGVSLLKCFSKVLKDRSSFLHPSIQAYGPFYGWPLKMQPVASWVLREAEDKMKLGRQKFRAMKSSWS
jgi:hypothetical protein